MAVKTKNLNGVNGDYKRKLVLALMKHHEPLFEKECVNNPKFIPRLCYVHENEKIIGFYSKELYGGENIYIEFCNRNLEPEDPNRTLWKWIYNPEFATEYKMSDPHPDTKDRRYLIPVDELINVTELHSAKNTNTIVTKQPVSEKESEDLFIDESYGAGLDVPYEAMTLRDYAAIQWKKPVSQKVWLNELITNTFK